MFGQSEQPTGLRWWGRTDVGRYRKNNEDAFLALTFDSQQVQYLGKVGEANFTIGDFAFAVSDGMGGANAGEFASKIAVDKVTAMLPSSYRMGASGFHREGAQLLEQLIDDTHAEMCKMGFMYPDIRGLGATLSLIWFTPEKAFFGHVGDSRIYYLPKRGEMKQITHDHSAVGQALREGKITEREAHNHPRRNVLDQVLGGQRDNVDPQVGNILYEPGDRFILCSDGVTDGVFNKNLERMVCDPVPSMVDKTPENRIVDEAKEASGKDNITCVVVEVY